MTLPEKKPLFFGASSPLKRTSREDFKGGVPPLTRGSIATFGPEMHTWA